MQRGILQGDSLSPLLIVLCMDPLSRKLNVEYPKVEVKCDNETYNTNHLIFIDDLKLFSETDEHLKSLKEEVEKFFIDVGFKINKLKSATNTKIVENVQ